MKMAIRDGQVILVEVDSDKYMQIKGRGLMKWNRQNQALYGPATTELLNFLASLFRLPRPAEELRQQMNRLEGAVDAERMNPEPQPLYKPPVKTNLFKHQVRGYNMCLLSFGFAEPRENNG